MELAKRQHPVIALRNEGYSYRKIAQLTGVSKSSCQRHYQSVLADARGVKDIERHRDETFADIEMTLEALRPVVLYGESPADVALPECRDLLGTWLKTLKAKREFLGLDAPKQTLADTGSRAGVGEPVENKQAAKFLADLAAWARRTNAINADGFNPALPPGMAERVGPTTVPDRASSWSRFVDFPDLDPEPHFY